MEFQLDHDIDHFLSLLDEKIKEYTGQLENNKNLINCGIKFIFKCTYFHYIKVIEYQNSININYKINRNKQLQYLRFFHFKYINFIQYNTVVHDQYIKNLTKNCDNIRTYIKLNSNNLNKNKITVNPSITNNSIHRNFNGNFNGNFKGNLNGNYPNCDFDNEENQRKFPCHICFKKFKRKHHLQRHFTTHSNLRPFQCNTCKRRYKLKQSLTAHQKDKNHL